MMKKPLDISEMTLDWVWQTEDPFFADLERSDRHLLYLVFVKEMDRQGIADSLGASPVQLEDIRWHMPTKSSAIFCDNRKSLESRSSGVAKPTVSLPASRCTSGGREVSRDASEAREIATRTADWCRSSLFDGFRQALLAPEFESVIRTDNGAVQFGDQLPAVDQERLAGLVTAETVHQFDSAAAAHPEEPFDPGAVQYGRPQRAHGFQDLRKPQKPGRLGRHERMRPPALC